MAKQFRLVHLPTLTLQAFTIGQCPPYIAASHTWSDQVFTGILQSSFGTEAIQRIISSHHHTIQHCWVDNFCIIQDDDNDKMEQIPLMGDIYQRAEAVAIILTCPFGFTQHQVDDLTTELEDAIRGWHSEAYSTPSFIQHWTQGAPKQCLIRAMHGLARLTRSPWATRIWTLQEYILASSIIWIGSDLHPITISDEMFQALPDLCNRLDIRECSKLNPEFEILHTHFSGMANSRMGAIDCTRTMEILGNRKATVPVDEVYGIMACCGVIIKPLLGESRERAWQRWCEAAIKEGNVRWVLLSIVQHSTTPHQGVDGRKSNCIIPPFGTRHLASSASYLDHVAPLGQVSVANGTITLSARIVGSTTLLRRLGTVHQSDDNILHNDITLILFSRGNWTTARKIVQAFGAGRYKRKQQLALSHVLIDSYTKALRSILRNKELGFRPIFRSQHHYTIWADFMQLASQCILPGLNTGCGYLARITDTVSNTSTMTVVIMRDGYVPTGKLVALDLSARTSDERYIILVAEHPTVSEIVEYASAAQVVMHKLGTTIPVANEYRKIWDLMPLERISLGGEQCCVCAKGSYHVMPVAQEQDCNKTVNERVQKVRLARLRADKKRRFDMKSKSLKTSRAWRSYLRRMT